MKEPKLVAKFQKNAVSEIRIALKEWKEKKYIDLRVFTLSNSGEQVPTKKGVSVPIEKWNDLKSGILLLEEAIKKF